MKNHWAMPKIFLLQDLSKIFERFLAKQSKVYEPCAIIGLDPKDLEGIFVFRELFEVFLGEDLFDVCLMSRIDESDAGAFEAGTTEATTIDSGEGAHNLVDGD